MFGLKGKINKVKLNIDNSNALLREGYVISCLVSVRL